MCVFFLVLERLLVHSHYRSEGLKAFGGRGGGRGENGSLAYCLETWLLVAFASLSHAWIMSSARSVLEGVKRV